MIIKSSETTLQSVSCDTLFGRCCCPALGCGRASPSGGTHMGVLSPGSTETKDRLYQSDLKEWNNRRKGCLRCNSCPRASPAALIWAKGCSYDGPTSPHRLAIDHCSVGQLRSVRSPKAQFCTLRGAAAGGCLIPTTQLSFRDLLPCS